MAPNKRITSKASVAAPDFMAAGAWSSEYNMSQLAMDQAERASLLNVNRLKAVAELSIMFLIDLGTVLLLFKGALYLRTEVLPLMNIEFPREAPSPSVLKIWWVFSLWVFFFAYEGLYTKRYSFWDEIKAMWKVSILATVGVFTIASVGKLSGEISRTVIVLMGAGSMLMLPGARALGKSLLRRANLLKRRVLILGAGKTGRLISGALVAEPNYGYEVVGYLDDDPEKVGLVIGEVKVHKGLDNAARYISKCNITDLVVAIPGAPTERVQGLVAHLQHKVDRILIVPDMFGMTVLGTTLQHFFHEQAIALELKNNLSQPLNYYSKRLFDYSLGMLCLAASLPLIAVLAAIIWITTDGPALYKQRRIGKGGRPFRCYKFRTMRKDAEELLEDMLMNDPEAEREWQENFKLKCDPRVTPVGGFLRKTSLDELPQLFNVMRGEMSLVGPRPVTRQEIDRYYKDQANLCFSVLPGLTGLWQVSGRSNTGYDYRIALDSWYVRNWNPWLDIVILLKTVPVVFKRDGAC